MCNILKAHVSQPYKPSSLLASILHISLLFADFKPSQTQQ